MPEKMRWLCRLVGHRLSYSDCTRCTRKGCEWRGEHRWDRCCCRNCHASRHEWDGCKCIRCQDKKHDKEILGRDVGEEYVHGYIKTYEWTKYRCRKCGQEGAFVSGKDWGYACEHPDWGE